MRKKLLKAALLLLLLTGAVKTQAAGTINLFGTTYNVSDPIDLQATTYKSPSDHPYIGMGGQSLDFVQGASAAQDRLYLSDETGQDGENAAFLTGSNPTTYQFDATNATLDFITDAVPNADVGLGVDPVGIVWLNDTNAGSTDKNILMTFLDGNAVLGVGTQSIGFIDKDKYQGVNVQLGSWNASNFSGVLASSTDPANAYGALTATTGNIPNAPTKVILGGTFTWSSAAGGDDLRHFGYKVYNIATNALTSDYPVILNQIESGAPVDGDPTGSGREFYALAGDGTNYYAVVQKPGSVATGQDPLTNGEAWIYKLGSLADPSATQQTISTAPLLGSARIDVPGVIDRPSPTGNYPNPPGVATSRIGLTTGRTVNGVPIFYFLMENNLYTLVLQASGPTPTASPTATSTPVVTATPNAVTEFGLYN